MQDRHQTIGGTQIDPDYHFWLLQTTGGNIDSYLGHIKQAAKLTLN
jgi:hypothetical protein